MTQSGFLAKFNNSSSYWEAFTTRQEAMQAIEKYMALCEIKPDRKWRETAPEVFTLLIGEESGISILPYKHDPEPALMLPVKEWPISVTAHMPVYVFRQIGKNGDRIETIRKWIVQAPNVTMARRIAQRRENAHCSYFDESPTNMLKHPIDDVL